MFIHSITQTRCHLSSSKLWEVQSFPPGRKALDCKWVYRIKYRSDGTVERFKARLLILGNHQVEGVDYTEMFAPVAKMVTIGIVLAVAATREWELHQMDVHNAFIHGELEEEKFMKMPPGFYVEQSNKVCKLRKSLYGLKQAPQCWFAKLPAALKDYGFKQSYLDYSLFTLQHDDVQPVVLIYFDDLIVSGCHPTTTQKFKNYLSTCFHMKDLGVLKFFWGVEVTRSSIGIYLCQHKYALDIISESGLLRAKPASIPLEHNRRLSLANGCSLDNPEKYRRLVG